MSTAAYGYKLSHETCKAYFERHCPDHNVEEVGNLDDPNDFVVHRVGVSSAIVADVIEKLRDKLRAREELRVGDELQIGDELRYRKLSSLIFLEFSRTEDEISENNNSEWPILAFAAIEHQRRGDEITDKMRQHKAANVSRKVIDFVKKLVQIEEEPSWYLWRAKTEHDLQLHGDGDVIRDR
ncbi:hypothetical protein C8Q70DRAFT_934487 [Cubamyces menziesii]|nr:hypothetical protein C8Q70DRAFT_934487 [Cubamyces menziesii]